MGINFLNLIFSLVLQKENGKKYGFPIIPRYLEKEELNFLKKIYKDWDKNINEAIEILKQAIKVGLLYE